MKKRIYLLIGLGILAIIAIIAIAASMLWPRTDEESTITVNPEDAIPRMEGKGRLTVTVNPEDAIIIVAGQKYAGNIDGLSLGPGNYTVQISRYLFKDKKITAKIENGKESRYDVVLKLAEEAGKNYETLSKEDQEVVDLYDSINTENDIKRANEQFPMISSLPHYTDQYHIDYGFLSDTKIFYDITIQKEMKNDPVIKDEIFQYLQGAGVDTAKAVINYYYEDLL